MAQSGVKERETPSVLEELTSSQITRRKFLVMLGATSGAAALTACTRAPVTTTQTVTQTQTATATATTTTPPPSPEVYMFFNQGEAAIVKAACARLIPGSVSDPGAAEAGAHVYIDHALAGYYISQQETYRRGLAAMEAYSKSKSNAGFATLTAAQQDQVLTDMQNGATTGFYAPTDKQFLSTLIQHTREGTFADPLYGGNLNLVGWKMIGFPGAQVAYGDADMVPTADQATKKALALADTESIPMPMPQSGF